MFQNLAYVIQSAIRAGRTTFRGAISGSGALSNVCNDMKN
jgi:hypothetical protein